MSNQICVRFAVSSENMITGITEKVLVESGYYHMSKIVLIAGYKPEKHETWIGELPSDGEVWICGPIEESQHDDPDHGALFVKLIQKGDTIPAKFTGIDVVFNADWLCGHYWNGNLTGYYPVFNDRSGDASYHPGETITATADQEARIRQILLDLKDYRGQYVCDDSKVRMMSFNGNMSVNEASEALKEQHRLEHEEWIAKWLAEQEKNVGKFIYAAGDYYCGRIEIMTKAWIDEQRECRYTVMNPDTGEERIVYGTGQGKYVLSQEMVDWLNEMARIALMQPVPTDSEGYYGRHSEIPFPEMPVFSPHNDPEDTDRLESVTIRFTEKPQVRIKTKYMLVVFGQELNTPKGIEIKLNPADFNPVGRAIVVEGRPPYLTAVPANVRHPQIWGYEAELVVKFGWGDGVTRYAQRSWPMVAHIDARGVVHAGGFVYEWREECPYEIPAENGGALKTAQKWLPDTHKEAADE